MFPTKAPRPASEGLLNRVHRSTTYLVHSAWCHWHPLLSWFPQFPEKTQAHEVHLSHNQNQAFKWFIQNHASRIELAAMHTHLWYGDCPFPYPSNYPGVEGVTHFERRQNLEQFVASNVKRTPRKPRPSRRPERPPGALEPRLGRLGATLRPPTKTKVGFNVSLPECMRQKTSKRFLVYH